MEQKVHGSTLRRQPFAVGRIGLRETVRWVDYISERAYSAMRKIKSSAARAHSTPRPMENARRVTVATIIIDDLYRHHAEHSLHRH